MYTNLTSRPKIICLCADLKVKKIQLEIAEITSCQGRLLQFILKIINLTPECSQLSQAPKSNWSTL